MNMIKGDTSLKRKIEHSIIIAFLLAVMISVTYVLLFVYTPSKNSLGALGTVCMDVISILILMIFVVGLVLDRDEISRTTKMYVALMVTTIYSLFFDFLTWTYDGALAYGDKTFAFIMLSFVMGDVLAFMFIMYISNYLDDMYGIKKVHFGAKICLYCNATAFFVSLIAAVTGNAFEIIDGHYKTGNLYDFLLVLPVLTLLYITAYTIFHVKVIGAHDVIGVVGYIVIMIIGVYVEDIYSIGTTYVSLAIADVFIYVMLQNRLLDRAKEQREKLTAQITTQTEKLQSMAGIINQEKKNVQKWIRKSNVDELTGCYNRNAYEIKVEALDKVQLMDDFVYVSIDVNSLKLANDTLGHDAGDELLLGACDCMRRCFGPYGNIYRTGGDEFVALIYADDNDLIKIKESVKEITGNWKGKLVDHVAISCGYVTRREATGLSMHDIAVMADKRMYEDKREYYQERGIDRRGQHDAHVALIGLYTKILKVNITDDSYHIININSHDQIMEEGAAKTLSGWLYEFGASGNVHPDDVEEYQSKANLDYIRNYFADGNSELIIFYRRKYQDEYKKSMMEIIPANDFAETHNMFLYVKKLE